MLFFSTEVQGFIISTYDLLLSELSLGNCEIVNGALGGKEWVFSDFMRDALLTILKLPCVPGEYSISGVAWSLFHCEFDFEDKLLLAA